MRTVRVIRRWEQVDTRHPWDGGPIEVECVYTRHFFRRRALRSARYHDRNVRQPHGDRQGIGGRATYRVMVRDRRTGRLESAAPPNHA
jgi:hypothetical protein